MSNELYLGQPDEDTKSWIKNVWPLTIPFHFEVLEDGNIKLVKNGNPGEISLLYSFDNKTWQDWDYVTGTDVIVGQKLYLKSKTDTGYFSTGGSGYNYKFSITNKVNVAGNIMSLIYNDFINKNEFKIGYIFYDLFEHCTTLLDASKLTLPAIKFSTNCYRCMFEKCTSLTKAPELPPTIRIASSCYRSMFNSCKSLTQVPELPITTLDKWFYNDMFGGCTSLVNAPKLPATTLAEYCYEYMFTNCLAITELHYPKSIENNSTFTSMSGSPWFGATNATVYYDL